jgi:nucleoside-diphosphate-sugar epimerase
MSKITNIAIVCNETNKVWCHLNGDPSPPHWGQAPQWQVDSVIDGVLHALAHPDAKPEDSHMNWMAGKIADGWVYGEVKDTVAKTHPCMVPFDQMPEWQQKKDKLFLAIVRALA